MKSEKGFTLVEMLVALLISSILILMVGVLSQVAFSSHDRIRTKADVYDDVFYGLSRLSFQARKASTITLKTWANPPWLPNMLVIDNSAFGLYRPAGSLTTDFVFVPDINNTANREPILTGANPLTFTFSVSGKLVTVQELSGTKNSEGFSVSDFKLKGRN